MDLKHLARLMLNDAEQNCEDLAWANELSRVGERLLEVGQPFGPRRFRDLSERERVQNEEALPPKKPRQFKGLGAGPGPRLTP
jgi:hypothetical protein